MKFSTRTGVSGPLSSLTFLEKASSRLPSKLQGQLIRTPSCTSTIISTSTELNLRFWTSLTLPLPYSLDSANAKLTAVVNLVKKINGGGTKLIDGIGTQMHLSAGGAGGAQAALTLAASAGVEVAITGN